MIELVDILGEVDRTLRVMFPTLSKVHLERVSKLDAPAMSLEVIGYKAPTVDPYVSRKVVDVEIVYFSKNNSVAEALAVQDVLTRAFSAGLKVKDRFIHMGEEIDTRMVDQVLHFIMQFDYFDELKPLIATKYEHPAQVDPGASDLDNVIDEENMIPDPTNPTDPTDPSEPGGEESDTRPAELVEELQYMEILKIDYTLD